MAEPIDPDVAQAPIHLERRITNIEHELARLEELRAEREMLITVLDLLRGGTPKLPAAEETPAAPTKRSSTKRKRPAKRRSARTDSSAKALAFLEEHPGSAAGPVVEHLGTSQGGCEATCGCQ